MALKQAGRGSQVAFVGANTATSPLKYIKSYDYNPNQALNPIYNGDASIPTYYPALSAPSITVVTTDFDTFSKFVNGEAVSAVVLTVKGATFDGAGVGSNTTFTLANAVVDVNSSVSHDNASNDPAELTVVFRANRAPSATADPAITIA